MMRFVRSIVAQYNRRGNRDFSSSRSNYHDVEDSMKTRISVMQSLINHCCGLAIGTGCGYLVMGSSAETAQQVEEDWKKQQLELEAAEARLENMLRVFGAKRTRS